MVSRDASASKKTDDLVSWWLGDLITQVGVWYADHSTPNPLGVQPDPDVTKIGTGDKFSEEGIELVWFTRSSPVISQLEEYCLLEGYSFWTVLSLQKRLPGPKKRFLDDFPMSTMKVGKGDVDTPFWSWDTGICWPEWPRESLSLKKNASFWKKHFWGVPAF